MRNRLASALALAFIMTTAAIGAVAAQWPTTCVELNDIVEAHLGNDGNVGIYQRVFGDAAETACQNDHRDDVRSVFAWAIGGIEPAVQPAPAPAPAPSSSPQSHPDYERVRQVALARGADDATATNVAASVVTQGNVDSFLRGTHQGVAYGEHGCQYRSSACPLSPERPPEPITIKGTGRGDSNLVNLRSGLYRVTVTYRDNTTRFSGSPTNFILSICESRCRSIANEINSSGTVEVFYTVTTGRLYVNARIVGENAKWEVRLDLVE